MRRTKQFEDLKMNMLRMVVTRVQYQRNCQFLARYPKLHSTSEYSIDK